MGNKTNNTTDYVEAYLVEGHATDGASGSPVFVRSSFRFEVSDADTIIVPKHRIRLLGLLQSGWFLPPDDAVRANVMANQRAVAPVGIEVVVPAEKIIELLESEPLREQRASMAQPISSRLLVGNDWAE